MECAAFNIPRKVVESQTEQKECFLLMRGEKEPTLLGGECVSSGRELNILLPVCRLMSLRHRGNVKQLTA